MKIIKKIVKILNLYSIERAELGISEINRETGIPKGTVHRIISSLEEENLLEKGEDQRYRLGGMLFHLGKIAEHNMSIREIASPILKKISQRHACAAHLAYLVETDIVYIDKHVANHFFEFASKLGMRFPAYATALGKIMLAYHNEDKIKSKFANVNFKTYTANTIANIDSLIEELNHSRKQGYAVDNEEISRGLKCFAAPIFNLSGEVEAAISLSKPTSQLDPKEEEEIIISVTEAAKIISNRIGYKG